MKLELCVCLPLKFLLVDALKIQIPAINFRIFCSINSEVGLFYECSLQGLNILLFYFVWEVWSQILVEDTQLGRHQQST